MTNSIQFLRHFREFGAELLLFYRAVYAYGQYRPRRFFSALFAAITLWYVWLVTYDSLTDAAAASDVSGIFTKLADVQQRCCEHVWLKLTENCAFMCATRPYLCHSTNSVFCCAVSFLCYYFLGLELRDFGTSGEE